MNTNDSLGRNDDDLPEIPRAKGIAKSIAEARPGQLVLVGADGAVTSGRWPSAKAIVLPSLVLLLLANVLELFVPGGATVAMVVVTVGYFGYLGRNLGPTRKLTAALRAHGAGDLDEAQSLALAAARSKAGPIVRGNAWLIVGAVQWSQGELGPALESTRLAVALLPSGGQARGLRVLARLNEIELVCLLGDLPAARALRDAMRDEGLPEGDLVQLQWMDTELVLAFEADDASTLPTDLDPWVRMVLDTNTAGSTLVLLAWALTQRGQTEMVPTLLDVAEDRLPEAHIDRAHPRLHRWYVAHRG